MSDFEDLLQRQPLRPVPPAWRAEILTTAAASATSAAGATTAHTPAPATTSGWRTWFWPSPYAWATLAAVWLLILGLNLAAQPAHSRATSGQFPSSPEIFAVLLEQRRLLDELTRAPAVHTVPPLPPAPNAPGACLTPRNTEPTRIA